MALQIGTKQENKSTLATTDLPIAQIVPILLIAGLGFLVDVYDIVLFAVVRIPSLESLGVAPQNSLAAGVLLLNMQMAGMIVGGLLWGILGDKKGRKSVLFGSILLYSLANLANGFVSSVPVYWLLRFLAGVGLAGEVGAAMTIAAEVTPARYRAYGTAGVAGLGVFGAVLASFIGGILPWRIAFVTAGIAGLLLLLARMSMRETPLFSRIMHNDRLERGSVRLLFQKDRLLRLTRCVLAAVPLWFAIGVIVSFAPEIRGGAGSNIVISIAAVALSYSLGETLGEVVSGILSQFLRSRKLAMLVFVTGALVSVALVLNSPPQCYRLLCLPLGFFIGYWSVVMTTTAEQFGTNLRATATTLVPNLVRASTIPITVLFSYLSSICGPVTSAMITGGLCFVGAIVSIALMEETFGKDIDFVES
jgi:putative MFS transporter